MSFTSKDYRRIGLLFYPVKIHDILVSPARGRPSHTIAIEVIDEPINERELREMIDYEVIHRFDGY